MSIHEREVLSNILFESNSLTPQEVINLAAHSNDTAIELLMLEDSSGCPVMYYLLLENNIDSFKKLMEHFANDFLKLSPGKWSFALWHEENECHAYLKTFYGENYYYHINDRAEHITERVTFYTAENIVKYWNQGQVKDFFSDIKNIHFLQSTFDESAGIGNGFTSREVNNPDLLWGLFLSIHQEALIKQVKEYYMPNNPPKLLDQYKPLDIIMNTSDSKVNMFFPKKKTVDILIELFGKEKGWQNFLKYLNLRKDILLAHNKNGIPERETMNVVELFEAYPEILCNKKEYLPLIRQNIDLFSYCLMTDMIDKHDLLSEIKNPVLVSMAQYKMLQNAAPSKENHSKRKI